MNKRTINSQVYKALLARSGNKCAFPGCTNPIFNQKDEFVAQLCHIEGVKGERYNSNLSDEEINSYSNLMFLCYKHHIETDNEKTFTVDTLKEMKLDHESKYILSPMVVDMSHIYSLHKENEEYWNNVEFVNTTENVVPDLKIDIAPHATYEELYVELEAVLKSLESIHTSFDQSYKKNWEIFNFGFPDQMIKVRALIEQMRIKFYEAHLANNPHDNSIKGVLKKLRKNFIEVTTKSVGHAD
jgi:hypothetical protein